jgi:N-glycosylase/DNA lyase
MFDRICTKYRGRDAIIVDGLSDYSLRDTLECGQAFRYELLCEDGDYVEYLTVTDGRLITVGQENPHSLIFFGIDEKTLDEVAVPYFALNENYDDIRREIADATDSEWLKAAAECARGIRILKQSPEETIISFIISQNNNIPRIRKIIRRICAEYGKNLATDIGVCPKSGAPISEEVCRSCGVCYTFPTSREILERPDGLAPARVGFRYGYIIDAAEKITGKEVDLELIRERADYEFTLSELKKIKGVGDKVASCVALFAFNNLDAFPIDVWMKRAIDTYFDGRLDPKSLGKHAGVAQQYIFHYIRNLENS